MRVEKKIRCSLTRALSYSGRRYKDPICGRSFRRFIDGPRGRPNVYCPRCRSAERHRVLWLYLKRVELAVAPSGLRVLHVAPEVSLSGLLRSLPAVRYVSTDLNPAAAMVGADLTALPFGDQSFDLIVCNHVLEHVPDDIAAMSELRRVLTSAGLALMQHPIDPSRDATFEDWAVTSEYDRERIFFQRDHVRIYGRDFDDRLRRAGYTHVQSLRYQDQLPTAEVERFRLAQLPSAISPERDLVADTIYRLKR